MDQIQEFEQRLKYLEALAERPVYMNTNEAAKFLSYSPKTLRNMVQEGKIPHLKKGRRLLFIESDLIEWVESKYTRKAC